MFANIKNVQISLTDAIENVCSNKNKYTNNPCRDHTRNRTMTFKDTVSIILGMTSLSSNNEIIEYFNFNAKKICTTSAFVQQRSKIKYDAFKQIFNDFTKAAYENESQENLPLIAVDGSDVITSADENAKESFFIDVNGDKKYNLYHVNALFDLNKKMYTDVIIQDRRNENEQRALCQMVDQSNLNKALLIGDRGYEGYNCIAHLQNKGWYYLIRLKSSQGIMKGLTLPNSVEFDAEYSLKLCRKQTKELKELYKNKNAYKYIPSQVTFDYLPLKSPDFYTLSFRIVRFKVTEELYESVITNLPVEEYPPEKLKELYAKRWGIETSFRKLKYITGLIHFHSRKREHVFQEIYAGLLMYNYTEAIIGIVLLTQNKKRKYTYVVNFSTSSYLCRNLYKGKLNPESIIDLLSKYITPIRPNRQNTRYLKSHGPISFIYRVA